MRNVVIDTNVIISAAITPNRTPEKAVLAIMNDENSRLYYSSEIISEYRKVFSHAKLNISAEKQRFFIETTEKVGLLINRQKAIYLLQTKLTANSMTPQKQAGRRL